MNLLNKKSCKYLFFNLRVGEWRKGKKKSPIGSSPVIWWLSMSESRYNDCYFSLIIIIIIIFIIIIIIIMIQVKSSEWGSALTWFVKGWIAAGLVSDMDAS